MKKISELQKLIIKEIENHARLIAANNFPSELYEPIEYILTIGGKRLRPVLVLESCQMFSDSFEQAILPAIGIEIFHNFTLLHDDIMDKSPLRRNKPTVHTKWNENIALLSGDAMMIIAYKYIAKCEHDKFNLIFPIFNQTALEICEGQQYDMNFENRSDVSTAEYLKMIELKTSVLIAACLKIGSLLGGAKMADADKLYDFGKNIGLAFQLQDDYLDVYGDSAVFGKKIGGDIVSNKKTFFLVNALELAEKRDKETLLNLINAVNFVPSDKIKSITEIYNKLNIKKLLEQQIQQYYNLAFNSLKAVEIEEHRKQQLMEFANNLLFRNV